MTQLPDYWRPRPSFTLDDETRAAFNALIEAAVARGPDAPIEYDLDAPKWHFLCYLAEERGFALHGSGNANIEEFEPRQPHDLTDFGAQRAVYATADGIWPLYFALLDRENYPTSLMNGAIRVGLPNGEQSDLHYLFSIGRHLIGQHPWREGTVYILPRETFTAEPPFSVGDTTLQTTQLASLVPVRPLAKLTVQPEDFPFLTQMLAHDDDQLEVYGNAVRTGAPWPDKEAP